MTACTQVLAKRPGSSAVSLYQGMVHFIHPPFIMVRKPRQGSGTATRFAGLKDPAEGLASGKQNTVLQTYAWAEGQRCLGSRPEKNGPGFPGPAYSFCEGMGQREAVRRPLKHSRQ